MVPVQRGSAVVMVDTSGKGPTQRQLANEREKNAKMTWKGVQEMTELLITHPDVSLLAFPVNDVILHTLSRNCSLFFVQDTLFPKDPGTNPLLSKTMEASRAHTFRMTSTFNAHDLSVSGYLFSLVLPTLAQIVCSGRYHFISPLQPGVASTKGNSLHNI